VIQGYAVEIFADVFSNEKSGVKEGQSVDTVLEISVNTFLSLPVPIKFPTNLRKFIFMQ